MFEDESTGNRGYVQSTAHRVILSTAPDEETAVRLAHALVDAGLAACVNIVPKVRSVYRWQGNVEDTTESMLVVKTTAEAAGNAAEVLRREHPYDCPEVLAIDVAGGLETYLAWLTEGSGG